MSDRELFLAALDLPSADRLRFLAEQCVNDPARLARVAKLLAAHEAAGNFLEQPLDPGPTPDLPSTATPIGSEASATADHHAEPDVGVVIAGKYKLLQQIGEGGMGTVWMADQTEPVKRRVAVKLIRVERGRSGTVLARFEAERQAIALMDHPHFAKLLDAGTEGDRPFFVMELVKGVPLTEYCDAHRLSIPERLNLFMQICSASQHAHQKGIIHRDLKPSNILVESHDGKPVPKVIDFGLAKATSGLQLTEHTLFTGFGTVLGTPTYMAPEQAMFNAVDIDTRADIYALGVILYELLTGTTPISRTQLRMAALEEILRLIREEDAPTPSIRVGMAHRSATGGPGPPDENLPTVAANRQTEPAKLGRFVKGDLDWIVMKALSKDRDRRYETANGFAKDVERFLNHEPVLAGPPSIGYKLRKFVRRNRPQVIAGCLVVLALLAGMVGTALGLIEARRQEGYARAEAKATGDALQAEAEERRKAEAKEAEANAMVKFFEEQVFAAARPKGQDGGLGAGVTLRDAIAASEPALDKGFVAQPFVEARLRMALGTTFLYLAEHNQARIQYERARALRTRHLGPDHPDTLSSLNNLAISYAALDRPAEALKLFEEVLATEQRALPPDHPDTLASMYNVAHSYAALNRQAEALKLRQEVLAIRKRVLPPEHPDTLRSMNSVATSYADLNRPTEALKLYEEVLAIRKRVLSKDHPDTLKSMMGVANSYAALNRSTEALKLREEVLAIQQRVLPKDHPDTLLSISNLARSYAALNRHAEALKLREEVLAIQKRVLPPEHPSTLRSMSNLAASYAALNRHAEALKLLDELLPKANRPGVDSRLVSSAISLRLQCCQKVNDPVGCRTSAEMWEKLDRPDAGSLYNAACCRAVTAAVQAKAPGADAARLAQEDADKAMAWLSKAVVGGYKDAARMKKDSDLDSLRVREDFKKLLADLDAKFPPPKKK